MHLVQSQNFGGLSRVSSNAQLLNTTNGKSSSDLSNVNREQLAQGESIISTVFNRQLGDTTLDNAALASKLHDIMLLFDDDDVVEEDVSSLSLPNPSADSCFGIVDSITLTRCKRYEFLEDDEDGDLYEYDQSEYEEDKDLNRVAQKATALCTHSRSGIRRGIQHGNIVAIKTKTTDG